MNIFSGNSLWHLVCQSDTISTCVLLLLLGMSVMCWTLFLCKFIIFYIQNKQCKEVNKQVYGIKKITYLVDAASTYSQTYPGYFLSKNLHFLKELLHGNLDENVSEPEWESLQQHAMQLLETMIIHNESYLPLLSSCATSAPLLGLFGTVWGLIHSFMRISETQVADIATVAPGIAEALITTLAGLIVAIPALLMFNFLQTKMHIVEHQMTILSDRYMFAVQQLRRKDHYAYTSQPSATQTHQPFN